MALCLDRPAQAAVARRRARGRDTSIALRLVYLRCWQPALSVGWAPGAWKRHGLLRLRAGTVDLYVSRRLARYAQWHDVTISAAHLGPLTWLIVVDESHLSLDLLTWEQTHPCP